MKWSRSHVVRGLAAVGSVSLITVASIALAQESGGESGGKSMLGVFQKMLGGGGDAPGGAAPANPFGAPAAPGNNDPFGAPAAPGANNPFGAPAAPGTDNPFGAPAAPGADNPFGAPSTPPAPMNNTDPFGAPATPPAPSTPADPFSGDNPFGTPATPPASTPSAPADPFGSTDTPFGAPSVPSAPAGGSSGFGAGRAPMNEGYGLNLDASGGAKWRSEVDSLVRGSRNVNPLGNLPVFNMDEDEEDDQITNIDPNMESRNQWEEFIHYCRVVRQDLAILSGKRFLGLELSSEDLMNIVENGQYSDNFEEILFRAQRVEGELGTVAEDVLKRIEGARVELSRDPARIRRDIEALPRGLRPKIYAIQRLQASGEYAAPQLLEALIRREDQELHPHVMEAMVSVGRPIVSPLCVALEHLEPVTQQQVARVLANINYPLALPFLRAVSEDPQTDASTKNVLELAFGRIASQTASARDLNAAGLFLFLSEDYYARRKSLIVSPENPYNLKWNWILDVGLRPLKIPTPVYFDVMAMDSSKRSLREDPNMEEAMSLWIAANFRRENNLPPGEDDPSYPTDRLESPAFYGRLAGPRHLHPVLQRGLEDGDHDLALDAIRSLAATAGATSLLTAEDNTQPLLAALASADHRVRLESAFAIARARPQAYSTGLERVVPVLAESIRQTGELFAVAIAPDLDELNVLATKIRNSGNYQVIIGTSLEKIGDQLLSIPGVDLVAIEGSREYVEQMYPVAKEHHRFQTTPFILFAESNNVPVMRLRLAKSDPRTSVLDIDMDPDQLKKSMQQSVSAFQGKPLTAEEATSYAMQSVQLLRDLAIGSNPVLDVVDAKPALIQALDDPRAKVVGGVASVLARMNFADVQQAIADKALDPTLGETLRVNLFQSLAENARLFSTLLNDRQARLLLDLIDSAHGDLADAAAEAYGSLNLQTADVSQMIIDQK